MRLIVTFRQLDPGLVLPLFRPHRLEE
jgi:uncharacterized secreted protein with C-terminal beta-propeller domain